MNETSCHLSPLSLLNKITVGLFCTKNNFKKKFHSWNFAFLLGGYPYVTIIFVDPGGLLIMQVEKAGNVISSPLHDHARAFDNPLQ